MAILELLSNLNREHLIIMVINLAVLMTGMLIAIRASKKKKEKKGGE